MVTLLPDVWGSVAEDGVHLNTPINTQRHIVNLRVLAS